MAVFVDGNLKAPLLPTIISFLANRLIVHGHTDGPPTVIYTMDTFLMLTQADTENTYKFDVKMTCGGCSGAVTRALKKAQENGPGISSYDVSLEKQEVLVVGTVPYDDVLSVIQKTGKEVRSGGVVPKEGVPAEVVN